MKLLFDQNLAYCLEATLQSLYQGSRHVRTLAMERASDDEVWTYARDHDMTIVTKDSDFYYRSMLLGHPPKVLWLRLGNCTTAEISEFLQTRQTDILAFEQQTSASFLTLP